MKKKLLALLLVIVLVVSLVPITTLADEVCEEHQWDWTKGTCKACGAECDHPTTVKKYPNCLSGGYVTTLCATCGKVMGSTGYEKVEPGSHTFVDGVCVKCKAEEAVAPCEHEWDIKTGNCSLCGAVCKHPNTNTTYPNCFEGGNITTMCADCGRLVDMKTVEPGEHNYINGACTKCGYEEPEEECKHVWNWATGQCKLCRVLCSHPELKENHPNCADGGYITKKCTTCGHPDPNPILVKPGSHTFKDGVCTVCGAEAPEPECEHQWDWTSGKCDKCGVYCEHAATKVNYGKCDDPDAYETTVCAECGHVISFKPVSGEHTMVDGKCTKCGYEEEEDCEHQWNWTTGFCDKCGAKCEHAATEKIYPNCVEGGDITERCAECHHTLEIIPAEPGDHVFKDGKCTICGAEEPAGPCEHDWSKDGKCTICGEECGHEDKNITVTATCTASGYTTVTCNICENILAIKALDALGHNFKDGVCERCGYEEVIVPDAKHEGCLNPFVCDGKPISVTVKSGASCTEDGVKEIVYACTLVVNEPIPATGHKEQIVLGHTANCGKDGLTAGKVCSVCGEVLVPQEVIPATGKHVFKDGVCTVCGAKEDAPVKPTGKHEGCIDPSKCDGNPVLVTVRSEATCTQVGVTEIVYPCGKLVIETSPMLDHEYSKITIKPTCTEDGKSYSVCIACGTLKGEAVITPALGHDFILNKVLEKPTCDKEGLDEYICTVCRETKTVVTEATGDHNYIFGVCTDCGAEDPNYVPTPPVIPDDPDEPEHACDHGLLSTDLVGLEIQKNPTCTETGLRALYQCKRCGKYFCMLADRMQEVDSCSDRIVIPALGHNFVNGVCTRCGAKDTSLDEVPKTGDNTVVILSAMTGVALLTAAAYVYSKKRNAV